LGWLDSRRLGPGAEESESREHAEVGREKKKVGLGLSDIIQIGGR
jgi:hypothetical protein